MTDSEQIKSNVAFRTLDLLNIGLGLGVTVSDVRLSNIEGVTPEEDYDELTFTMKSEGATVEVRWLGSHTTADGENRPSRVNFISIDLPYAHNSRNEAHRDAINEFNKKAREGLTNVVEFLIKYCQKMADVKNEEVILSILIDNSQAQIIQQLDWVNENADKLGLKLVDHDGSNRNLDPLALRFYERVFRPKK